MIKYQVYQHQSILDVAIQLTGTIDNALWIAKENELNPSDDLTAGMVLIIPYGLVNDIEILKYYILNKILPATALTQGDIDIIIGCEGIECWAIEIDFKVS